MTEDKKPLTDAERKAAERKKMTDQGFMLRPFWIHATRIADIESIREELLKPKTIDGPLELETMAKKTAYLFDGTEESFDRLLDNAKNYSITKPISVRDVWGTRVYILEYEDGSLIRFQKVTFEGAFKMEVEGYD